MSTHGIQIDTYLHMAIECENCGRQISCVMDSSIVLLAVYIVLPRADIVISGHLDTDLDTHYLLVTISAVSIVVTISSVSIVVTM